MLVPVADYGPDVSDLNTSFTDELMNVIPSANGYLPFQSVSAVANALPSKPLGWFTFKNLDGSVRFFAGTSNNLYLLNATTLNWTEVSKASNVYAGGASSQWSIKAFGTFVIATNGTDPPQVYDVSSDIKFRDLGGSPPIAKKVAIWGDFVALMGIPSAPNRVQWSGLNNAEFWTPGANNSDYQDFADGGRVQGTSETTNPLIFLENAIYLATFVPGSVEIFTFQKIHEKRGAYSPDSIASRGSVTFFADTGGFFQIEAGGQLTPIGFEKVDRTIFGRLLASSLARIQGAIDPFYSRVYWLLDYTGSGVFDKMAVYDWQLGKWTIINISIYGISPLITFGYTLEGLDAISATLDGLGISLDSKQWQGGAPVLAAFTTDNRLATFTGANLEATVVTQEIGETDGAMQRTSSTYPVSDAENVFVSIGVRIRRSDDFTWLPEQTRSGYTGRIYKRSRARYHKMKIRIPAGEVWTRITGLDVDAAGSGSR